jgi:hypothetical protein
MEDGMVNVVGFRTMDLFDAIKPRRMSYYPKIRGKKVLDTLLPDNYSRCVAVYQDIKPRQRILNQSRRLAWGLE